MTTVNGVHAKAGPRKVVDNDVERDSIRDEGKVDLGFELTGTAAIFAPLPEATYLAGGVIRTGSVVLLGGYGGSKKTWLGLQLVLAVATGTPWLGRFDCKKGDATVLDWESGSYELRRRMQRLAIGMGIRALESGVDFATMPDAYMGTPKFKEAVLKLSAHRSLVMLDSLRAATPGAEENDSSIRHGLDQLRSAAEQTDCAFLVLVHSKKVGGGAQGKPDARESLRGSSAIFDAADGVLNVTVGAEGEPLRIEHTKSRHGRAVEPFGVNVSDSPLGTGVLVEAVEIEAKGKPTGTQTFQKVCSMVERVVRSHPGSSQRFIRANLDGGARLETVATALEHLAKAGRVENTGTEKKQEWRISNAE